MKRERLGMQDHSVVTAMPGYGVNTPEGLIYGQNLSLQVTGFVADHEGQMLLCCRYTFGHCINPRTTLPLCINRTICVDDNICQIVQLTSYFHIISHKCIWITQGFLVVGQMHLKDCRYRLPLGLVLHLTKVCPILRLSV